MSDSFPYDGPRETAQDRLEDRVATLVDSVQRLENLVLELARAIRMFNAPT